MPSKKCKTIAEANAGKSTRKRKQHVQGLADKRMTAKESSSTSGEAVKHFATADGPAHSSALLMVSNDCINFRRIQKLTTLIQLFGLFWKSVN